MPEGLQNLYVQLDTVKVRPKMRQRAAEGGVVLVPAGRAPQQVEPMWHRVVKFEDEGDGSPFGGLRTIYTGCGLTNKEDLELDSRSPWRLTESATEPYTARCPRKGCFGQPKPH